MAAPKVDPERSVRVPQQRRSRRTRQAVLQAAAACFEESGYDETTTAMIARRAGISVGSVYSYFRDKREILIELLETHLSEVARLVAERLDVDAWDDADPREVVRDLIDTVFHTQRMRPGLQRILWERHFKDEVVHDHAEAIRERMRAAIRTAFARLASRGELRDLAPATAAAVVLNAVQWNAANAFMYGTPEWIDEAAGATADMVLRFLFRD